MTEGNGLTDDLMERAKDHIDFVSGFYGITPVQSVLFSHFVGQGYDKDISPNQIAQSIGCKPVMLFQYLNEFDALVKKKLLTCKKNKCENYYYIPLQIIESLKNSEAPKIRENKNLSIFEFFDAVEYLVDGRNNDELSVDDFICEVDTLIDNNMHLLFSQAFRAYHPGDLTGILMYFCERLVNNDDDTIGIYQLENLFESPSAFRSIKRTFKDKSNVLFSKDIIENSITNDGFGDTESLKLTEKARNELFAELNIHLNAAKLKKDLILADTIIEKKMFYNPKEEQAVRQLTQLLSPGNFNAVLKRLTEKGMRSGFACLFYGGPGTGKTETVNMLARSTGRDIMLVDISKTKSCWFGESEKKIKQVFDKYKTYVEVCETTPILLFNEADGIIGKRKDVDAGNVAQTENAIQNIILQELENLKGILIATTNLTQNMDKAFERRFLYKIEFQKPAPPIRALLWKELLPELSCTEAHILAESFDFSGGQIENIARKRTIEFVLSGSAHSLDTLIAFCQDERLDNKPGKSIGFGRV
jgi:hypothetical protein